MENESGGSHASSPGNRSESSNTDSATIKGEGTALIRDGSFSLSDLIAMHLQDCQQCYTAVKHLRPVGMGQKSPYCDVYWQLQLDRAEYEGKANNIVAYTELGDEAKKRGRLQ